MHPIMLFLLLVGTSTGLVIPIRTPLERAKWFQTRFDNAILSHNRKEVTPLLLAAFKYEECNGRVYDRDEFVDLMATTKTTAGVVLEARADKRHVIYVVQYGSKQIQFMITDVLRDIFIWKMDKAQEWLC